MNRKGTSINWNDTSSSVRWKKSAGSGIPRVAGSGQNRENHATLWNILQLQKLKKVGANKDRVGTRIRGYVKREV